MPFKFASLPFCYVFIVYLKDFIFKTYFPVIVICVVLLVMTKKASVSWSVTPGFAVAVRWHFRGYFIVRTDDSSILMMQVAISTDDPVHF